MPELLHRLMTSARQSREAVHLMRLGLQMEKLLGSGGLVHAPVGDPALGATASASNAGERPAGEPMADDGVRADQGTPHGLDFAAMTGLDAGYFAAQPGSGMNFS